MLFHSANQKQANLIDSLTKENQSLRDQIQKLEILNKDIEQKNDLVQKRQDLKIETLTKEIELKDQKIEENKQHLVSQRHFSQILEDIPSYAQLDNASETEQSQIIEHLQSKLMKELHRTQVLDIKIAEQSKLLQEKDEAIKAFEKVVEKDV